MSRRSICSIFPIAGKNAGKSTNTVTYAIMEWEIFRVVPVMKVITATRRKENGRTIVNLKFKTKDQLLVSG